MDNEKVLTYSPKLKMAMEQIKKILKENDIAGVVVLHTPGFSEYLNHVTTSYSCAEFVNNGLQFRLKQSEVGKDKAREIAEGTYNLITHLSNFMMPTAWVYVNGRTYLQDKWVGTEEDGTHTSHQQQNN